MSHHAWPYYIDCYHPHKLMSGVRTLHALGYSLVLTVWLDPFRAERLERGSGGSRWVKSCPGGRGTTVTGTYGEAYSCGMQVWLSAHWKQIFPGWVWNSKDSAKVNQSKKWKIPPSQFIGKLEPETNVSGPACLLFPDRTPRFSRLPKRSCLRSTTELQ